MIGSDESGDTPCISPGSVDGVNILTEQCFDILQEKAANMGDRPKIAGVTTQVNPSRWRQFLCNSNSWDWDSHYVLDGVVHGFHMLDKSPSISPYEVENYESCFSTKALEKLNNFILQELSQGKLSLCLSKPVCIHAMGAIIKESGGVRPITDCSRPTDNSVNCYTKASFTSFKFVKLSEILQSVTKNCYLCTVDVQAAYRSILIHISD